MAETPIEENYEEATRAEEPVREEQDTQDDCSEQSEPEDDGGTPNVEVDGDENGEIDRATQDTDDLPPSTEEITESRLEQDIIDVTESDDEENSQGGDPDAPVEEEETHSSGYNLRKRKEINYRESRRYNTTATVLYQHGEVTKVKENLVAKINQEEALEPRDIF